MTDAKKYALIDLHIHLDGSLSLSSARALADMQGISLPADDDTLLRMLRVSEGCRDLNEYLEKFALPLSLLQTSEAISASVERLCGELSEQGLLYAEIRFAPQLHCERGLTQDEVVRSAILGLKQSGFRASLILCCMRGENNRELNLETVRLAKKHLGLGVCALDLAGAEALFPNENFIDVIEYAKSLSLPMTLHAGEALGSESVSSAIELGADRIGHGVRSIENPELLQILSQKKIALELCPTSNLNTRVFERIEDYPLRRLLDAGVCVTINTDNTTVSNTSLANELTLLCNAFALDGATLARIERNAIECSFADKATKKECLSELEERLKG